MLVVWNKYFRDSFGGFDGRPFRFKGYRAGESQGGFEVLAYEFDNNSFAGFDRLGSGATDGDLSGAALGSEGHYRG